MINRIRNLLCKLFGADKSASLAIKARKGGIPFRHKGCRSEVARYNGLQDLDSTTVLKGVDWVVLGVQQKTCGSRTCRCPDCGETFAICKQSLEEIK